ncbi:MAG: hypothetical protein ACKV22_22935, partial [Bryobacteraceae bacterium]
MNVPVFSRLLTLAALKAVASVVPLWYAAYVMRALLALFAFPFLVLAQFTFHTADRSFSFGSEPTQVDHARLPIDVEGAALAAGRADRASWEGPASGGLRAGESGAARFEWPLVEWIVRFSVSAEGRSLTIASSIRNRGAQPIRLGRCRLLDGPLRLGAGADQSVVLVMSGWQGPSRVRKIAAGGKPHLARILVPVYNA